MDNIAIFLSSAIAIGLSILAIIKARMASQRVDPLLELLLEMSKVNEEAFDEVHERMDDAGMKQTKLRMHEVRHARQMRHASKG